MEKKKMMGLVYVVAEKERPFLNKVEVRTGSRDGNKCHGKNWLFPL